MSNDTSDDNGNIIESLFEPGNAEILTQLRDGPKSLSDLVKNLEIPKQEIGEKLSYLIAKKFINKIEKNGNIVYSINIENLTKILENNDNFQNIDNGLAKLDSFLN